MSSICTHTHTFVIVISLGNFLNCFSRYGFSLWLSYMVISVELVRGGTAVVNHLFRLVVIRSSGGLAVVGVGLQWSK